MIRTSIATVIALFLAVAANAQIYTVLPASVEHSPTKAVDYGTEPVEGSGIIMVDVAGIFSFDVQGSVPPNETRTVDVGAELSSPGQPYRVVGVGWDVEIDAFIPSWMSDASIAFGADPTYVDPQLFVSPGMGFDYGGFMNFSSNGIIDLATAGQGGTDLSFEIAEGILYLEFFEVFDDFGNGPIADAQWRQGSVVVQVEPVPEPTFAVCIGLTVVSILLGARRSRLAGICLTRRE